MSTDRLSLEEAARRAEQVSNVTYRLHLDLEAGAKSFSGEVRIGFDHTGGDTFLEWLGGHIEAFEVNGSAAEPDWDGYRIQLPASLLEASNEVVVRYQRPYDKTGEGLHHFLDEEDGREYLYTQFEPYSCHRLFPCFDQPDLKSTYDLEVTAPESWAVTGPSPEEERTDAGGGRSRRVFETTPRFSTYLMSVVAGEYLGVESRHGDTPLGLYARASLMPHLETDAEALFDLTSRSMDYFGNLFGEPYPFGKYDQLFVPEFNWGGMENVGNVTYTDTVVFRDPPTADQVRRRNEFFTHELAHMWFGDLVTLKWWEDLWLNESFASYAAYLALDALGEPDIWQDFNMRMKVWAYREDQRPTTHRIADEVASTDETFLNFDGITYGKGASVLKQLARAIGPEAFRDGLRAYFRRHRFGNATLADFLAALQQGSGLDLVAWAAVWLKTPSLNTIRARVETSDGTIESLDLKQTAPEEHPYVRPHHFDIALVGPDGEKTISATIGEVSAAVPEAAGLAAPDFVYPNAGDHGYFKVSLDPESLSFVESRLGSLSAPLLRQQVWASLGDMVRDGAFPSTSYLELVHRHLPSEGSPPILQMVTTATAGVVSRFVPEASIDAEAARFVATATEAIASSPPGDLRVLWARALVRLAVTEEDALAAAALLDDPPEGLSVDQELRWALAIRWASLGIEGAEDRLDRERERDPSDRGARAMLTARVAVPDPEAKQEAWDRLHGDGYESMQMAQAAAAGFWRRKQAALVEPFVGPFFQGLPAVFVEREAEAARAYLGSFFPRHRIDEGMRERIAAVLDDGDIGPMLRRMLVEEDDELRRAIRARALAADEAEV